MHMLIKCCIQHLMNNGNTNDRIYNVSKYIHVHDVNLYHLLLIYTVRIKFDFPHE